MTLSTYIGVVDLGSIHIGIIRTWDALGEEKDRGKTGDREESRSKSGADSGVASKVR